MLIISVEDVDATTFNATEIPSSSNAIHQYTIDWSALSRGEEGLTVQVDSDADGAFEHAFSSDSELTREEFLKGTTPVEGLLFWLVGIAVAVTVTAVAVGVFLKKRKKPPVPPLPQLPRKTLDPSSTLAT